MRSISRQTAAALKTATGEAYEVLGGTVMAADVLGVGSPVLSKYASRSDQWAESFIRIDLAVDLDRRSEHPFILTTMARETGYRVIKDTQEASDLTLTPMGVLKLDRILDSVVHETAQALADGHVSEAEKRDIRKRISAAKIALAKLDQMLIGGDE